MQSFVLISMPRGQPKTPPSGDDLAVLNYHRNEIIVEAIITLKTREDLTTPYSYAALNDHTCLTTPAQSTQFLVVFRNGDVHKHPNTLMAVFGHVKYIRFQHDITLN